MQQQQQHMSAVGNQNTHPTRLSRSNTSGSAIDKTPSHPAIVKLLFSNDDNVLEGSSQYSHTQEHWYHPEIDRTQAETMLNKCKTVAEGGLFILRNTSQDAMLCVSVVYPLSQPSQSVPEGKVYHNRIEILENGMFRYLGAGHGSICFHTCRELINHHHADHPRLEEIDAVLNSDHMKNCSATDGSIRLGSYIPFMATKTTTRTQTLVL
eukprot:m.145493 g.145493  ORF g.145493 m.145493 type:complete len:209 (+) comp30443_c6_seq2:1011-1637(+)